MMGWHDILIGKGDTQTENKTSDDGRTREGRSWITEMNVIYVKHTVIMIIISK